MRYLPLAIVGSTLLAISTHGALSPIDADRHLRAMLAGLEARGLEQPIVFSPIAGERELSGTLHVRAKNGHTQRVLARVAPLVHKKSSFVEEYVLNIPAGMDEESLAWVLMSTGDYEFAQPNWTLFPASTTPNDPQYGSSWQHTRLESANAWDLNTGSSSVVVAICDTGIDLDHPDLEGALVNGYNSWTNDAQIDGGDVSPSSGHGTFVAGCAAAIGNNATGVVGVGWNLSIMPIRVTSNTGAASSFSISDGARWAADNGAHVVNVSFTGATSGANTQLARDLKAMGALLFYAAGNDNANISGNRPDFVIVSATTSSDNKWGSSNFGSAISVAAPGAGVRSTQNGGGYGNGSGTSYAAPVATGVGAMIFSVNPDLGPDDVQEILYASVDDLGVPGRDDTFGFGRVNTFNAVVDAQSYTPRVLLPLAESFESASWMDLLTATSGSVSVTNDASAPDGSSVLVMDSTDTVETALLAGRLAINSNYMVSMMVKAQGVEGGESLEIQYLDESSAWVSIASMPSLGVDTDGYTRFDAPLESGFTYHGVSIRIIAHGSDSSDVWMIDDLRLEPAPTLAAPFDEPFDMGTLSPLRWDTAQSDAPIGTSGGAIALELVGDVTAESLDIDLTSLTIDGGYLNFMAATGGTTADTLHVEYRNFFGNWSTLDTIDASSLTGALSGQSYEIPFLGLSDSFRLRLSDTSTSGGFFVDDINISADPLMVGCSPADFTGDGTLDIFDVFAFLDAFNASDLDADFTGDGSLDIFDVFAFLDSFNAGCP